MPNKCSHLDQIKFRNTDKHVCEDCVKTGDSWVHLRLCLICGHVAAAILPRPSTPPNTSRKNGSLQVRRDSPFLDRA